MMLATEKFWNDANHHYFNKQEAVKFATKTLSELFTEFDDLDDMQQWVNDVARKQWDTERHYHCNINCYEIDADEDLCPGEHHLKIEMDSDDLKHNLIHWTMIYRAVDDNNEYCNDDDAEQLVLVSANFTIFQANPQGS